MPPARFEHAMLANERPQIHTLDLTATGIENYIKNSNIWDLKFTFKPMNVNNEND
jgi:hypothetical protein